MNGFDNHITLLDYSDTNDQIDQNTQSKNVKVQRQYQQQPIRYMEKYNLAKDGEYSDKKMDENLEDCIELQDKSVQVSTLLLNESEVDELIQAHQIYQKNQRRQHTLDSSQKYMSNCYEEEGFEEFNIEKHTTGKKDSQQSQEYVQATTNSNHNKISSKNYNNISN